MGKIVYLSKSNKKGKKFMVRIENKTIHFGDSSMSDYTIHKDKDRMLRYSNRHKKRENWTYSGVKTAGFWSKWLLWNKPSLLASKKDISERFNIVFKKWSDKKNKPLVKKSVRKSRAKTTKKSVRKSRAKTTKKSVNSKYERCILSVKSKQPKKCFKKDKWKGGEACYNPWAICNKLKNK